MIGLATHRSGVLGYRQAMSALRSPRQEANATRSEQQHGPDIDSVQAKLVTIEDEITWITTTAFLTRIILPF